MNRVLKVFPVINVLFIIAVVVLFGIDSLIASVLLALLGLLSIIAYLFTNTEVTVKKIKQKKVLMFVGLTIAIYISINIIFKYIVL